jgi:hypothetical protein
MTDKTTTMTSQNIKTRFKNDVRTGNSTGRDEVRSEIYDQLMYEKVYLRESRILRMYHYNDTSLKIQSERLPNRLSYYRLFFVLLYPFRGFSSSGYCS